MKSSTEPTERDLVLGKPIRPEPPAKPDPVKPFEVVDWTPRGLVISDAPAPVVTPGDASEWEGMCLTDDYTRALLGCI
jgi:hypothetical protein